MPPNPAGRTPVARILAFAAAALAFWWLWDSAWLWPFKVLVVLFHELSHGLAAVLTGGEVVELHIAPDQSGYATTRGGSPLLIMNAGYVGSLLWGMALLALARKPRTAKVATLVLGVLLFGVTLVYVRPILSFGFAFSLLVSAALALGARFAPIAGLTALLQGVGLFSILYVLWFDILGDVFGAPIGAVTDATLLADYTGIPAMFWGVTWLIAGSTALFSCRRWLL